MNFITNNNPVAIPMVDALKQQFREYDEQMINSKPQFHNINNLPPHDLTQEQNHLITLMLVLPEVLISSATWFRHIVHKLCLMNVLKSNKNLAEAEMSEEVHENQKRKSPHDPIDENGHLEKTVTFQLAEEKKKSNLRKNIREVMDSNQLDTNTLKAQHEESERLACVAEQQKLLREYQQREAVLTHFDRFVNEHRVRDPADLLPVQKKTTVRKTVPEENYMKVENMCTSRLSENIVKDVDVVKSADEKEDSLPSEVVTIEDSSDDDDCIVLSDDEADLEDENDNDDPNNSGIHVNDEFNVPDHLGRVVINVGHPEDEEDIL
ncbi:Helicase ARIP4 [Eumeta japonica]|uniref:Helicase ARIP4 n=1 Tax=Eumeta variegata TaxID=151549 RepID=A0A4C1SC16_EUMVA|nr:Helicase ARIP4 [Eumeta japonica]